MSGRILKKGMSELINKRLEELKISNQECWCIYGAGNGAECLFDLLDEQKRTTVIKYVVDRDEMVLRDQMFHDIPVVKLKDIVNSIDGILIAAMDNGKIIEQRILESLTFEQLSAIKIVDIFVDNTDSEKLEFVDFLEKNSLRKSESFVPYDKNGFVRTATDTKILTWYLPQFHQMEINNKFHGQGFTEWTNATRMLPLFTGHYQPHIPYDVGYYDVGVKSKYTSHLF